MLDNFLTYFVIANHVRWIDMQPKADRIEIVKRVIKRARTTTIQDSNRPDPHRSRLRVKRNREST